jgi:hypothetical protein
MLEKSRPLTSNITSKESMALKSLKHTKEIRIQQTNKGNCMLVLNESIYTEKISSLLESGVYETLHEDPMSQIERKVFPSALKHKLTPYHSKPPHLYGLLKMHKPDIPLDQQLDLLTLPVMP